MAFGFVGFQHFDSIKTVKGMWKRRDVAYSKARSKQATTGKP